MKTPLTPPTAPAAMHLHDVSVDLGGRRIVHGVTLDLPAGRCLGLLGPNGSGKSTLIRAASGMTRPAAGHITIDGTDIATLRPRQLARLVAVMIQEHTSDFSMHVEEVVMLGRTPHQSGFGADSDQDREIVAQALADVEATHLTDRIFSSLSGGEKQRVLLARAFAQQTPLLILDEPTNHLDVGYQIDLLERVAARGVTVLAALHDMNLAAQYCDELALLVDGSVVAQGHPEDVLTPDTLDPVFRVTTHHVVHPRTGRTVIAVDRPERTATAAASCVGPR
ncbi:iron complex transport system ATP-binding protein [Austwickia chelonae]|uniref:Putative ABC transporter ATP-binding protein n=1 Tax=Austwickia chelonae NBRC 105200 TaxID=1184607 RepID=K6W5H7_9MICO|nr:ABC transporter ATP-binding protein [Austwickia chelonae]GAB77072.1 putative ABC transporter ATP-binding protein [Austwickia chelonae NBRC 105200]SEW33806.1 iron complex transport system ATP-binding protein [Austwickia chelonae]